MFHTFKTAWVQIDPKAKCIQEDIENISCLFYVNPDVPFKLGIVIKYDLI